MGRPLRIGISANIYQPDPNRMAYKGRRLLYMEEGMFHWVMSGGALPFLIPTAQPDHVSVKDLISQVDGVIMTGGVDMAPESYGESALRPEWGGDRHRDLYDIALVREALNQDKPLLGICRGHQVLNVALGGSLYQDVFTQHPESLHHRIFDVYEDNIHDVEFVNGGHLAGIFQSQRGKINSVHHQAVKKLGQGLRIEAVSPEDGVVESVKLYDEGGYYLLGVQWHPELQSRHDTRVVSAVPILEDFLAAVKKRN